MAHAPGSAPRLTDRQGQRASGASQVNARTRASNLRIVTGIDLAVGVLAFAGGLIAALIGVAVGHRLATERDDQNLRREAAEQIIATAMEALTYLAGVEVMLAGGAPPPDMRDDFARDAFLPIARFGLMGKPDARKAAEAIGDAQRDAIAEIFRPGSMPAEREAKRGVVMERIHAFRALAEADFKS